MIVTAVLVVLMILVFAYDASKYIIPNWLNGLVLLLFPYVLLTADGVDWQTAYLGALATFVAGFLLYAIKQMGAGDVKLFAALAPFVGALGWQNLISYLLLTTVAGGALALALVIVRKGVPWVISMPKDETRLRILRHNAPVPYGLAIAGVFLYFLFSGKAITG